jgi:hypothetical protein
LKDFFPLHGHRPLTRLAQGRKTPSPAVREREARIYRAEHFSLARSFSPRSLIADGALGYLFFNSMSVTQASCVLFNAPSDMPNFNRLSAALAPLTFC